MLWSEPQLGYCATAGRLDAEYYRPDYLRVEQVTGEGKSLRELRAVIIHPTEVKRLYTEEGIRVLLAQNIRNNQFDWSVRRFMTEDARSELANNKMVANDVAIARSGANFGQASFFNAEVPDLYACADCLIVRMPDYDGAVLATFFNTKYGRLLLDRGAYGAAQPHIAPSYLYRLRIPILSEDNVQVVRTLVLSSCQLKRRADELYKFATAVLGTELGLNKIELDHSDGYGARLSEIYQAARWDAEFYRPRYQRVVNTTFKARKVQVEKFVPVWRLISYLTNGHTPLHHDLSVGEVSFLTAEHVSDFRLDFGTDKRILQRHHETELARTALRDGDILVTIKGKVGNCVVVRDSPKTANINQDVALIRLREGIHPYFFSAWFNSPMGKQLVEQRSTGGINPFLGLGNLRGMSFPVIAQKEQNRIGDLVQETVEKAYQAECEAATLLKRAKRRVEELIEQGVSA